MSGKSRIVYCLNEKNAPRQTAASRFLRLSDRATKPAINAAPRGSVQPCSKTNRTDVFSPHSSTISSGIDLSAVRRDVDDQRNHSTSNSKQTYAHRTSWNRAYGGTTASSVSGG